MTNPFSFSPGVLRPRRFSLAILAGSLSLFSFVAPGCAATVSPLFARGYTVIPSPQQVTLSGEDFQFTGAWGLELAPGVKADDAAATALKEELAQRFHLGLREAAAKGGAKLRLAVDPQAVKVGQATDRMKPALAERAYRIKLDPAEVTITGNSPSGLFYGVQTLVQLLKTEEGKVWLPQGEIVDWPDLELRLIYWDDAHHLDHPDVLKAAVRQAGFYKINLCDQPGHLQAVRRDV